MADLRLNIYTEKDSEAHFAMRRWRATFDDDYVTWGYGATPQAAAINLLAKYRFDNASGELVLKPEAAKS